MSTKKHFADMKFPYERSFTHDKIKVPPYNYFTTFMILQIRFLHNEKNPFLFHHYNCQLLFSFRSTSYSMAEVAGRIT